MWYLKSYHTFVYHSASASKASLYKYGGIVEWKMLFTFDLPAPKSANHYARKLVV